MINKAKTFLNKHKKSLNTFVLTNRQYISFVILSVLEAFLLIIMTVGIESWSFESTFFDLSIAILIGSIGYLIKPKKQYAYFQTVLIFITIICFANAVYYSYYGSFVTVSLLETLGQATEVETAVYDVFKWFHFAYWLFPLAFCLIHRNLSNHNYFNYVSKIEKGKKNFSTTMLVGIICLCINIVTLSGTDISRLVKQWNREYIVERYGVIVYQLNDIAQTTKSKLFTYFGYDEAAEEFIEYYSTKEDDHEDNKYTGIFEGKNIIFVHMESMMSMFVGMEINGQEVTPNLNKLVEEGLYFSNFYTQVSVGTSSDTEFTLNTSLMPALSGTVFVNYYDRTYVSIESLLKEKGYYTFSMHGNSSSMWNRNLMYQSLGYDTYYSKEYYNVTSENTIGLGISDHDFFEQIIPYLMEIEDTYDNYMGTIITLSNHTPWDGGDAYGDFDLTATVERINEETGELETVVDSYLEDTKIGNYIRSVHYADQCLGEFIEYLYEYDILNDTVLVFYGDHDSKLSTKEYNYLFNYDLETGTLLTEEDEGYVDYDYYANELNRKTPLIIWTKDGSISGEVDYYMGMIDVLPTIGNMMGFSSTYALGHDIFDIKDDNIIVFPNGNFLTSSIYYYSSKSEYKVLEENAIIDEDYIEKCKAYVEQILELSNNIIVYDLIGKEGDNITSEEETS